MYRRRGRPSLRDRAGPSERSEQMEQSAWQEQRDRLEASAPLLWSDSVTEFSTECTRADCSTPDYSSVSSSRSYAPTVEIPIAPVAPARGPVPLTEAEQERWMERLAVSADLIHRSSMVEALRPGLLRAGSVLWEYTVCQVMHVTGGGE
uniref:Uncharacterized protein n=1 Tax=Ananas comosus var. bracteatus TaxID=296719 RepID=A0A6V7NNP3_ANACO|nr:unnamed protein product [Ananas comosus var. bracteatus]